MLHIYSWNTLVQPFDYQGPEKRGVDWQAIVRTLLVQVIVLLAVSVAIVGYLNWSSDANRSEFMDAIRSSGAGPKHQSQSAPIQPVKGEPACYRKA